AVVSRRQGDIYGHAQDGHLGRVERRVMSAIELCGTATLGGHTETCAECGLVRCAYNSCRNRHCPKCQGAARAEWLAARQAELLPVPYFHVVFTVPAPIAEIAFQNKEMVYAILFRSSGQRPRRCESSPPIRRISALRSVSSPSSTPGGRTSTFTHMSIASCRVVASRSTAPAGSPVAPASFCRCACSPGSSAASSWPSSTWPSQPA